MVTLDSIISYWNSVVMPIVNKFINAIQDGTILYPDAEMRMVMMYTVGVLVVFLGIMAGIAKARQNLRHRA